MRENEWRLFLAGRNGTLHAMMEVSDKKNLYTEQFVFSSEEENAMRGLSVSALVLFGSRAQNHARANSDYDIGVLVRDPAILSQPERRGQIYDALYDVLSARIKKLVNIDIVFLDIAPMELQAHVMKYGVSIFASDPFAFPRFKERAMLILADFAPLRAIFRQGILNQIT